jgi:hypothetical protein
MWRAAQPVYVSLCGAVVSTRQRLHRPHKSDLTEAVYTHPNSSASTHCSLSEHDPLVEASLSTILVLWQSEAIMPPSSSYRGVHWNKTAKMWRAAIFNREGRTERLGDFNDEVEAAKAYDR